MGWANPGMKKTIPFKTALMMYVTRTQAKVSFICSCMYCVPQAT